MFSRKCLILIMTLLFAAFTCSAAVYPQCGATRGCVVTADAANATDSNAEDATSDSADDEDGADFVLVAATPLLPTFLRSHLHATEHEPDSAFGRVLQEPPKSNLS